MHSRATTGWIDRERCARHHSQKEWQLNYSPIIDSRPMAHTYTGLCLHTDKLSRDQSSRDICGGGQCQCASPYVRVCVSIANPIALISIEWSYQSIQCFIAKMHSLPMPGHWQQPLARPSGRYRPKSKWCKVISAHRHKQ